MGQIEKQTKSNLFWSPIKASYRLLESWGQYDVECDSSLNPSPEQQEVVEISVCAWDGGIHYLFCCILSAMLHHSFAKASMQKCYVSKANHCARLSEYTFGSVSLYWQADANQKLSLVSFASLQSDVISVCGFLRRALGSGRSELWGTRRIGLM